ncbi:hypothetical protein BSKO_00456 [Bryopsis sp. KO-2023]|nr:hypothetical protein BSKO_00456 [Bryopsis sp. KO-2023]
MLRRPVPVDGFYERPISRPLPRGRIFHRSGFKVSNRGPFTRRSGFIGDKAGGLAQEYHSKDFEWIDLYNEVAPILEGQVSSLDVIEPPPEENHDFGCWESFHSQHGKGRFFKERRYLSLEFPQLGKSDPPQHFIEIGAGCGSSILPVLRSNNSCTCTACDVSSTALQLLMAAAKNTGIDCSRIKTVVLDAAEPPAENYTPIGGHEADCVLLVFTLSAVPPHMMANMLQHAFQCLRPGGLLLLRDYGLCDMTQLRYKASQRKGENLYQRSDGTLAYYFTKEFLSELMGNLGFEAVECEYVCVIWKNRKNGKELKRVFVHGIFKKPD